MFKIITTASFCAALLLAGCSGSGKGGDSAASRELESLIKNTSRDTDGVREFVKLYGAKGQKLSSEQYDELFMAYLAFHQEVADILSDGLSKESADKYRSVLEAEPEKRNKNAVLFAADIKKAGFELEFSETMPYAAVHTPFLDTLFKKSISQPYQKFLELYSTENNAPWAGEGGLIISLNECADRWVAWGEFMKANPDFPLPERYASVKTQYALAVLNGMDNIPAFDYESRMMPEEFKNAYRYLMKTYPNAEAAGIIKEYWAILEKSGFKNSPESNALVEKITGFQTQFGGTL